MPAKQDLVFHLYTFFYHTGTKFLFMGHTSYISSAIFRMAYKEN